MKSSDVSHSLHSLYYSKEGQKYELEKRSCFIYKIRYWLSDLVVTITSSNKKFSISTTILIVIQEVSRFSLD
jgi:hypothetical protein